MSGNPNQWYLSGDLSIDGNATLKAPDKGIYSLQLSRIDESGREHKWAFWHMNSEYRKNSLEIWEYKTDSSGKDCTGDAADGAMCTPRLVIAEGGNVGIGTTMPKAKLHIEGGAIMPAAGDSDNAGILFPSDPGGGGGDKAWIRYYPRAGGGSSERTVLEIGVANDVDPDYQDDISLIPSGAVGIGTREPQAKLHVLGNSRIDGDIVILGKHALRGNDPWLRLNQDGAFSAGTHTPGLFAPMSLNVGGVGGWGNPGNGNATFAGDIAIGGKHAFRGNDTWLRLNQDGAFADGVHTPGVFAPVSLNVGGMNGWGNPGHGNAWFTGSISYNGELNKLDVAEGDGFARIRAHDLLFGHSSRHGGMGRALVDDGNKLIINFDRDWQNVVIPGLDVLSTREVKININPLSENVAFRIIRELNPVTYNHKRWPDELPRLGFIAEDVPDEIASDDHKAIRPDNIIAVLTKVVQNQQMRIEALEKQVLSYEQRT